MKKAQISLKPTGIWSGVDRQSDMTPGEGAFYDLKNCYVSKDGTEIRRLPGWKAVMKPQFSEALSISGFSSGSETTVTTSARHGLAAGDYVRIVNPGIADEEDGYVVLSSGLTEYNFKVAASSTGSATTGTVYANRLYKPHAFKQVMGRTVFVGEDIFWRRSAQEAFADVIEGSPTTIFLAGLHGYAVDETFDVTITGSTGTLLNGSYTATATGLTSFTIPVDSTSFTAITAGTATWLARKSHLAAWVEADTPSASSVPEFAEYWPSVSSAISFSNLRDFFPIRRRSAVDVAGGRVLVASPGYGCCWQIDVRQLDYDQQSIPHIYSLGMPKGGLVTASSPGGSPLYSSLSVKYVAVAYRNTYTGEIGLISEPWDLTAAPTQDASATFVRAREMLREAPLYHDILVYGGESPASMKLLYVEDGSASSARGDSGATTLNPASGPDDGETFRIPFLEQMPPGSKFIATSRGYTLGGGVMGSLGDSFTADSLQASAQSTAEENKEVRVASWVLNAGGWLVPTAYQGVRFHNPPSSKMNLTRLNVHKRVAYSAPDYFHIWNTEDPLQDLTSATTGYLVYDRGVAWFSEPGEPGVAPSTNRIVFDTRNGEDLEGAGSYRNGWVVCSESETFFLSAGNSPLGQRPVRISSQYGCVAPNSFVEFDGGTAWLSRRGPVLFDGSGVRWIGKPVQPLFDACKTDSRAMMTHAIAGHDSRRGLIFWGLRKDLHGTQFASINSAWPDDDRSKVACDYFLIYSYRTGAWSTWEPPASLGGIWWMETITTDELTDELGFLAGDDWNAKVYVFDDDYSDGVANNHLIMGLTQSSSYVGTTTATFKPTDAASLDTIKVGMSYYVVDTATGSVTYSDGNEIVSIDLVAQTVTLTVPVAWKSTHEVYVGTIPMRIKTKLAGLNPRMRGKTTLTNVSTRHKADGSNSYMVQTANTTPWGTDALSGYRADRPGSEDGDEVQVTLDVVGDGVTRFKDIVLETAERG